jgi:hypothetical protein
MSGGVVLGFLYCNTCLWHYCYIDRVFLAGEVTVRYIYGRERECEMFILLVVYQLFRQFMFKTLANLIVYRSN